jgi:hypothetical protein
MPYCIKSHSFKLTQTMVAIREKIDLSRQEFPYCAINSINKIIENMAESRATSFLNFRLMHNTKYDSLSIVHD